MSNFATEQMLSAVQAAKENARRAEQEYNDRSRELRCKTQSSINLFGGTATNQVADIVTDARNACDVLYASYQTQIQILDSQCRPLLDQTPAYRAVKEVTELIVRLNAESEIENNYGASLNQHNLGNIVTAKYIPKMENKIIQSFWESKCYNWPGRYEEEQKIEEEKRREAEEKKQRAQAAQQKWGDEMQKLLPGMTRTEIGEIYLKQHICDSLYDLESGSAVDIIDRSTELSDVSIHKVRILLNSMMGIRVERDGVRNYRLSDNYEPFDIPPYNAPAGTAAALIAYERNVRMTAKEQEKAAQQERAEIYKLRRAEADSMCQEAIAAFSSSVSSTAQDCKSRSPEVFAAKINAIQAEKDRLNEKKSSLGLFQFSEKNQLSQKLQALDMQLAEYASPSTQQRYCSMIDTQAAQAIQAYKNTLADYMEHRFPYQTELKKATAKMLENATVQDRILLAVHKHPQSTAAAIHESDPVLSQMTMQKFSATLRLMIGDQLERTDTGLFTLWSGDVIDRLFRRYMPKGIDEYTESAEYAESPIPQPPEITGLFQNI